LGTCPVLGGMRELKNEGNVSREMLPLPAPNFSPQLII